MCMKCQFISYWRYYLSKCDQVAMAQRHVQLGDIVDFEGFCFSRANFEGVFGVSHNSWNYSKLWFYFGFYWKFEEFLQNLPFTSESANFFIENAQKKLDIVVFSQNRPYFPFNRTHINAKPIKYTYSVSTHDLTFSAHILRVRAADICALPSPLPTRHVGLCLYGTSISIFSLLSTSFLLPSRIVWWTYERSSSTCSMLCNMHDG